MLENPGKILVLGIGNEILKDDGIGPRLVMDLQHHFPEEIRFNTSSLGGLEILEMIREYDTVFIIDAIKTKAEAFAGKSHARRKPKAPKQEEEAAADAQ